MDNNRIKQLAILSDYLISKIPNNIKSKDNIISWLKDSPYSPCITLYGGVNSNTYNEDESFISSLDNKRRYKLNDLFSFKLENFINHDDSIYSANTRLYDVINTETLFLAYSEFKDIDISINISNSNNGNYSGSTYHEDNIAQRIEVFADNSENAMRVLLHELQHCIQLREGFEITDDIYNKEAERAEKILFRLRTELDREILSSEENEVLDVYLNKKNEASIKIDDMDDVAGFYHGSRKKGAKKILLKHGGENSKGGLSPQEMIMLGRIIRNGKVADNSFSESANNIRYRYDLTVNNTKLSVLIEEFNDGKKIIDLYSDRNFIDYGIFKYQKKNDSNTRSLPSPNEPFLDKIISHKKNNVNENIEFDKINSEVELLDSDSNTRALPRPNESIEEILPNKKEDVNIISKEERDRNYIDYGNKKYHKKGEESITKQQSCSLLSLDNILPEKNVNGKIKNEENIEFDKINSEAELLDNDSNTRSLPRPNESIKEILPNRKEDVNIISKEERDKNFKKWFGDSKVVDENGEPLVVYHGTGADFGEFKQDKNGLTFFTTNKDVADWFTPQNTGQIYPVYIKANKIFDIKNSTCKESLKPYITNNIKDITIKYLKLKAAEDFMIIPEKFNNFDEYIEKCKEEDCYGIRGYEYLEEGDIEGAVDYALIGMSEDDGWLYFEEIDTNILNEIKKMGFDSTKTYERIDEYQHGKKDYNIAVFEPTQIKSIHNKGTFDINNPNILEKNDYGLRHIEKVLSILPDNIKTSTVKDYLLFNGISHEHLRGSVYQNCLDSETFINPIKIDKSNLDYESSYYSSPGEKEAREIEELYVTQSYNDFMLNIAYESVLEEEKVNSSLGLK